MCTNQKIVIPENATDDERRAIMFNNLYSLNLSDKVESRNGLSYLPWSVCFKTLKEYYPSATYRIIKHPETHLPFFVDAATGVYVNVEVTVDGIPYEVILPVLDSANKAMKLEPYKYQVWDKEQKKFVDKTVAACSSFDINRAIMRALTKCIAVATGIGLSLFCGEDISQQDKDDAMIGTANKPARKTRAAVNNPATQDKYAGIKAALNGCLDNDSLLDLYNQHRNEVEGTPEIKALFTQRKLQLAA